MYSGGSGLSIDIHFVDIELSYDVLSPLPIVLSKHFNHPHPYIEIATAISDNVTSLRSWACTIALSLASHTPIIEDIGSGDITIPELWQRNVIIIIARACA